MHQMKFWIVAPKTGTIYFIKGLGHSSSEKYKIITDAWMPRVANSLCNKTAAYQAKCKYCDSQK